MRSLPLFLLTALLTAASVASAQAQTRGYPGFSAGGGDLPDLGSPSGTVISKAEEFQLGSMVAKEMRDQNAIIEDPEATEYLQGIGAKLGAQTPDGSRGWQFFMLRDSVVNAQAILGGFMFVNYGLVLATRNESELAGVLAHEMAHVTQHHIARAIKAQSQQAITSAAALLAAILLGAIGGGGSGQAIEGGMAAAQGLAAQQQINFTRSNEEEADRVGIEYLYGAGFNTNGLADFFEQISRIEGLGATYFPQMLNDHPVTSDRVAEARARAAQLGNLGGKVQESLTYELIRERMRVITADPDVDITKQFVTRIQNGEDTLGVQYGYALALTARGKPDEAEKILAKLLKEHEGLTLLYTALGQAQMKAGHRNEGLATLRHAEDLFPRNVPVTVRYAEGLMAVGRNKEAHLVLLDLFNNVAPDPEQIRLTALAASAAGDIGDAYYYMGEYQIAGGELQLAVQQYQLALASPNLTKVQRERILARENEIREYLATARLRRTSNEDSGR